MPVPASINDLSTTAASNSPGGGENPFPDLDNHIRAAYSFIASLRDGKLDASTVSAFMLTVLNDADAATARTTLGAAALGANTFTGAQTLPGNASSALHAVPKQQLDSVAATIPAIASSATTQAGTSTTQAVSPKALADSALAGKTQTWQTVTGSRSLGSTYTNSTGAPIYISVILTGAGAGGPYAEGYVDGVLRFRTLQDASGPGVQSTVVLIVPAGSTYSVSGANFSLASWHELRA